MGELIQFIFSLEDTVGRNIVWIILTFFVVGGLNYLWHIAVRLPWEWWNLHQAKVYFQVNPRVENLSDLLKNLRGVKVWSQSIIYRRVADCVRIKQSGGDIDNDALADILTGQESRKASLASHTLGILIILGLVGTLWGLITALIEVQPLLTGIQDFEQLPEISRTLKSTVSSMSTAFATTLTGLGTSLLLGILGWGFNRLQSTFLTHLEAYVSIVLMPQFVQTTDTSIETAVQHLSECTNMLEFATQENVRAMQQAIQQLTDTSWGGQLEQQYILANKFGTTAESLLESLTGISEYQILITTAIEKFQNLTTRSMSQIKEYQVTLRQGLEDSVPRLEEEGEALKEVIREYQRSQARFIDDLSKTLRSQLRSITDRQQDMIDVLTRLADEVQIRPLLETQNQIFERLEVQLAEDQQEVIRAFTQLRDEFQNRLHLAFETQNEVFTGIETQLTESQRVLIGALTQVTDELQIRSVLEEQNQVFKRMETQLIDGQQRTFDVLAQLTGELQIRSALEGQNHAFGRIENHLIRHSELMAEQKELMQKLIANLEQPPPVPSVEIGPTPGGNSSQQVSAQLLNQISLKFDLLNQKIDTLNATARQPGIYRWFSEIRRWFGSSR